MAHLPPNSTGLELELELGSIPLAQVGEGAESLLAMDVSDDLAPVGLQWAKMPPVPQGADALVEYYDKQLAAAQLVQHRLEIQVNQLTEEKMALETSLQVQTTALQQQLILVYEKAESACKEVEQAKQQVQSAGSAINDIIVSVTQLAESLDASGASQELNRSFKAVAHSTQLTIQAISAAQSSTERLLELQVEVKEACSVSPLLLRHAARGDGAVDLLKSIEDDALRLRVELEATKKREQDLEAEMQAAQLLFSGLEAEVVSLQQDQAQAAAKLQVSQEELLTARSQLVAASQALTNAESPVADVVTQGLAKLDAHMNSVREFLESLAMPQPPLECSSGVLQEAPSSESEDDSDTNAKVDRLRDAISALQQQLKVKDREVKAARYTSLFLQQRTETKEGMQAASRVTEPAGLQPDPCKGISSSYGGSTRHVPAEEAHLKAAGAPAQVFSYLLAARNQAQRSPATSNGGLSTVQVALIAAEREVLSLRSQLSHRQQHIKLLEQRLLEQSQDVAAMCNRPGDAALLASPVGYRKASFAERSLPGSSTEVLLPQRAWDFDGVDVATASGNLASQMRPKTESGAVHDPAEQLQGSTLTRTGAVASADDLVERDMTIRELQAQVTLYRAVMAAVAAGGEPPRADVQARMQTLPQRNDDILPGNSITTRPVTMAAVETVEAARSLSPTSPRQAASACQLSHDVSSPPGPRITLEDMLDSGASLRLGAGSVARGTLGEAGSISPSAASATDPLARARDATEEIGAAADPYCTPPEPDPSAPAPAGPPARTQADFGTSDDPSTQEMEHVQRQLNAAVRTLEATQEGLNFTMTALTDLQGLLLALSRAESGELRLQDPMVDFAAAAMTVLQLPIIPAGSVASASTASGGHSLGTSAAQLAELISQIKDALKMIHDSQGRVQGLQASAAAARTGGLIQGLYPLPSLPHATQAPRHQAALDLPITARDFIVSPRTLAATHYASSGGGSDVPGHLAGGPNSPSSALRPTPLGLAVAAADSYTPSLVMNPMFHREGTSMDSTGTSVSDGPHSGGLLLHAPLAAVREAGSGLASVEAQLSDVVTTVHRNFLFDDDHGDEPKVTATEWPFTDGSVSAGVGADPSLNIAEDRAVISVLRSAPLTAATTTCMPATEGTLAPSLSLTPAAEEDAARLRARVEELQRANADLQRRLSIFSARTPDGVSEGNLLLPALEGHTAPVAGYLTPRTSPGPFRMSSPEAPSPGAGPSRWPTDERGEGGAEATRRHYAASIISDLGSDFSQRVTELEEEILAERNSFADQLTGLKRAKRDLEAKVKELTSELGLKSQQLQQLQEVRGPRGNRHAEQLMSDLHKTVAGLTAELASKDQRIRDLQARIEDMEEAQSRATRLVSTEIAEHKQRFDEADAVIGSLRTQLTQAEEAILALQSAQLKAAQRWDTLERGPAEHRSLQAEVPAVVSKVGAAPPAESSVLVDLAGQRELIRPPALMDIAKMKQELEAARIEIKALEVQLKDALDRLEASNGKVESSGVDLEASHLRCEDLEAQLATARRDVAVQLEERERYEREGAAARASLAHEWVSARERSAEAEANVASLKASLAAAQAREAGLQVDLAAAEARALELQEALDAAEAHVEHLRSALMATKARVAELTADLEGAISGAAVSVDKCAQAQARVVSLEQDLKAANDRAAGLQDDLAASEAHAKLLRDDGAAARGRLEALVAEAGAATSCVERLQADLAAAENREKTLREELAASNVRVKDAEARLRAISEKLGGVTSECEQLRVNVHELQLGASKAAEEHMAALAAVEAEAQANEQRDTEIMSSREAALESFREREAELRSMLGAAVSEAQEHETALNTQLAAAVAAAEAAQNREADLNTQLVLAHTQLAELGERLADMEQQAAVVTNDLSEAMARAEQLQVERKAAEAAATQEVEDANSQLLGLQGALRASVDETSRVTAQLAQVQTELAAAKQAAAIAAVKEDELSCALAFARAEHESAHGQAKAVSEAFAHAQAQLKEMAAAQVATLSQLNEALSGQEQAKGRLLSQELAHAEQLLKERTRSTVDMQDLLAELEQVRDIVETLAGAYVEGRQVKAGLAEALGQAAAHADEQASALAQAQSDLQKAVDRAAHLEPQLLSVRDDTEAAAAGFRGEIESMRSRLNDTEARAADLAARLQEQTTAFQDVCQAHDVELQQVANTAGALAAVQAQNRKLWAQLQAIADCIGMRTSTALGDAGVSEPCLPVTDGSAPPASAPQSNASDPSGSVHEVPSVGPGSDGSGSSGVLGALRLSHSAPYTRTSGSMAGAGDAPSTSVGASFAVTRQRSTSVVSGAVQPSQPAHERLAPGRAAWSRPLNFKEALLAGAAKSAAAAIQSVGDVPISPGKSTSLRATMSEDIASALLSPQASGATSKINTAAFRLPPSGSSKLADGTGKFAPTRSFFMSTPGGLASTADALAMATGPVSPQQLLAAPPDAHSEPSVRGLQLLQPGSSAAGSGSASGAATPMADPMTASDTEDDGIGHGAPAARDPSDASVVSLTDAQLIPDVASAVGSYLEDLRAQARAEQERLAAVCTELDAARLQFVESKTEAEAAVQRLATAQSAISTLEGAVNEHRRALEMAAAKEQQLSAQVIKANAAREGVEADVGNMYRTQVALEEELKAAQAQRDALQAQVEASSAARKKVELQLAAAQQDVAEQMQQVSELRRARADLEEQLAATQLITNNLEECLKANLTAAKEEGSELKRRAGDLEASLAIAQQELVEALAAHAALQNQLKASAQTDAVATSRAVSPGGKDSSASERETSRSGDLVSITSAQSTAPINLRERLSWDSIQHQLGGILAVKAATEESLAALQRAHAKLSQQHGLLTESKAAADAASERQISELRKEKADLANKVRELSAMKSDAEEQALELTAAMGQAEQQVAVLTAALADAQEQVKGLSADKTAAEQQVEQLKYAKDEADRLAEGLACSVGELEQQLRTTKADAEQQAAALSSSHSSLQLQVAGLLSTQSELERQVTDLAGAKAATEKLLEEVVAAKATFELQASEFASVKATLEQQLEAQTAERASLEQRLTEATTSCSDLKAEKAIAEEQHTAMEDAFVALKSETDQLARNLASVEADFADMASIKAALEEQLAVTAGRLEAVDMEYESLALAKADADAQLLNAAEERRTLGQAVASAKGEVEVLAAVKTATDMQLQAALDTKASLEQALAEATAARAMLDARLNGLAAAGVQLEGHLEELQAAAQRHKYASAETMAVLEAEVLTLRGVAWEAEVMNVELESQVVALRAEKAAVEVQLRERDAANEALRDRLEAAAAQQAHLDAQLVQAELIENEQLVAARTNADALAAQLKVVQDAEAGLQARLSAAVTDLQEKECGLAELATRLEATQQRADQASLDMQAVQEQLAAAEGARDALQAELAKALAQATIQLAASRIEAESFANELAAMKARAAELQEGLGHAETCLADKDQALAKNQEILVAAEQRVADLEAEVDATRRLLEAQLAEARSAAAERESAAASANVMALELSAAQAAAEDLAKRCAAAEAASADRERDIVAITAALATAEARAKELQRELRQVESARSDIAAQLQAANGVNAQLSDASTAAERALAERDRLLGEERTALGEAQRRLAAAEDAVTGLEAQLTEAKVALAQMTEKLHCGTERRKALEGEVEMAERTRQELQAELATVKTHIVSLEARLDELRFAHRTSHSMAQEAEMASAARSAEATAALEVTMASLRDELQASARERADMAGQVEAAQAREREVGIKLDAKTEAMALLERELAGVIAAKLALEQLVREEAEDKEGLRQELAAVRAQLDSSSNRASRHGQEQQRLEAELRGQLAGLRDALDASNEALAAERDAAIRARDELRLAQQQLEDRQAQQIAFQGDLDSRAAAEGQLAEARERIHELEGQLRDARMESFVAHGQVSALREELAVIGRLVEDECDGGASSNSSPVPFMSKTRSAAQSSGGSVAYEGDGAIPQSSASVPRSLPPAEGGNVATAVAEMRLSLLQRVAAAAEDARVRGVTVAELEGSLAEARRQVDSLLAESARAAVQLHSAEEALQKLERAAQEKEAEAQQNRASRDEAVQELEALKDRIAELQAQIDTATEEAKLLNRQLEDSDAATSLATQRCAEAEDARQAAVTEAEGLRIELTSSQVALRTAHNEAESHRSRLGSLEIELAKVESQLDQLQQVIVTAEAQADELRGELAAVQYDLEAARDERDDAIRQLADAREEAALRQADAERRQADFQAQLADVSIKQDAAAVQLVEAQQEIAKARERRDEATRALEGVVADLSDARRKADVLQDELSIVEQQASGLADELAQAREERMEALAARDATAARVEELEEELRATSLLLESAQEAANEKVEAAKQLLEDVTAEKQLLSDDFANAKRRLSSTRAELEDLRWQHESALQRLKDVREVLAAVEETRSVSGSAPSSAREGDQQRYLEVERTALASAAAAAAIARQQQQQQQQQQRTEAARVADHLRTLERRADDLTGYAEDLQRRLNAADAHLTSERAEAQVIRARLDLHLATARSELEATAAERTVALQQLATARNELVEATSKRVALEAQLTRSEQYAESLQQQLASARQRLLEAEGRAAADRVHAESATVKSDEQAAKLRTELAATHAELLGVVAQRDTLQAQLAVVVPNLSAAHAAAEQHQVGMVRQMAASALKGERDVALLEAHLGPLESHARVLEMQAEDLRRQLAEAEARHASERSTLEGQVQGLQHQTDHLQQQVSSLQQHVAAVEARMSGERTEAQAARSAAAAVRAELAAVMAERDVAVGQAAMLRTELSSVRSDRDRAAHQQATAAANEEEVEGAVRSLQEQLRQLQRQAEAAGALEGQLAEAQVQLANERRAHAASTSALEGQLVAVKTDLSAALSNNIVVQQRVSEVHEELASLRKELAAATKELATQQAVSGARLNEMQAKLAHSRVQSAEANQQVVRLEQQLRETMKALEAAEQQLREGDMDAKAMVAGLQAALEATRTTLEGERSRGEQKAKELQDHLQAARVAEAAVREQLKHMQDELTAAREALQAAEAAAAAEVASLRDELAAVQRSLRETRDEAAARATALEASFKAANDAAVSSEQRLALLDAQLMTARAAEAEARHGLLEARRGLGRQEADAASRIARLEADLTDARELLSSLEGRHKQAEEAGRAAEDEIAAMAQKLQAELERTSQLEPRVEALGAEVASLQYELSCARDALRRYEAYAYDAEAEIKGLRDAAASSTEENSRLQQQLDELVQQLSHQTKQLKAAEEDTAALRQEVAAMHQAGGRGRFGPPTARSGDRRHASTGRPVRAASGGPSNSILDDTIPGSQQSQQQQQQQQQLLILRKPNQQHHSHSSGPRSNSTAALSRSGSGVDSGGAPSATLTQRLRTASADGRGSAGALVAVEGAVPKSLMQPGSGRAFRTPSPAAVLQQRLTGEAAQLRWEVVADSSRVRELQEKRAGGVPLTRSELSEMELLTARLGAHHARISAIMDTVKMAQGGGAGPHPQVPLQLHPRSRPPQLQQALQPAAVLALPAPKPTSVTVHVEAGAVVDEPVQWASPPAASNTTRSPPHAPVETYQVKPAQPHPHGNQKESSTTMPPSKSTERTYDDAPRGASDIHMGPQPPKPVPANARQALGSEPEAQAGEPRQAAYAPRPPPRRPAPNLSSTVHSSEQAANVATSKPTRGGSDAATDLAHEHHRPNGGQGNATLEPRLRLYDLGRRAEPEELARTNTSVAATGTGSSHAFPNLPEHGHLASNQQPHPYCDEGALGRHDNQSGTSGMGQLGRSPGGESSSSPVMGHRGFDYGRGRTRARSPGADGSRRIAADLVGGSMTTNFDCDESQGSGGGASSGGVGGGRSPSVTDSVSPVRDRGRGGASIRSYSASPSPTGRSGRSTQAALNVSPWYPPGMSPARMASPVRAVSPASVQGSRRAAAPTAYAAAGGPPGRSGTPPDGRDPYYRQGGVSGGYISGNDSPVGDTGEMEGGDSTLTFDQLQATSGGDGLPASGVLVEGRATVAPSQAMPAPPPSSRYRTPYMKMLHGMAGSGPQSAAGGLGGLRGAGRTSGSGGTAPPRRGGGGAGAGLGGAAGAGGAAGGLETRAAVARGAVNTGVGRQSQPVIGTPGGSGAGGATAHHTTINDDWLGSSSGDASY